MEVKTYFFSIDMAATGRNIARLRASHGYTIADLQKFFGFTAPQAIYKWQRGEALPSTDNLYALSCLLGVPMNEILIPTSPNEPDPESHDPSCDSVFFPTESGPPSAA